MSEERSDARIARELWPFLRADGRWYLTALLLAPLSAALVIAQPWLLQQAIDGYIIPGDLAGLQTAALFYLGAVVAGFLVETTHSLCLGVGAMRTVTSVRKAIYAHTLRLGPTYFDREPTGRLLTRATSDVEAVGETLTAGAITIVLDVLQVVGILAAMLWLDARLTLAVLVVAPPLAIILDLLRRRLRRLYVEVRVSLTALNAFVSERLRGIETVQLYADEARTAQRFHDRVERYRKATVRTNIYDALLYAVVDGTTAITLALLLWWGSGGVLEGATTAGVLAAFIDYVSKLFRPIQEFSGKVATLQRAGASLSKIFELLAVTETVNGGGTKLTQVEGQLVVRSLRFAYPEGPDVLHGVDLALRPGLSVGVCGRTGSGKSTLGRLITRTYGGYRGSITLDGHELRDLDVACARKAVGAVRQDVQLFPGSVRFNLTLGAPIADAALLDAIRLAHAEPVVARLGGLDGQIAGGGRNLSGGEAQLLSFARTLAHDPAIVVLDEATASVDALTEARIQAATEALLSRKPTLVIAHRLSTLRACGHILVMKDGRVVEAGDHDALMALGGVYAGMVREGGDAQKAS